MAESFAFEERHQPSAAQFDIRIDPGRRSLRPRDHRAYQVARRLRSGTVGQNVFRSDFAIAFGAKQSGIGREGGVERLLPFLKSKTVILDGLPKHQNS